MPFLGIDLGTSGLRALLVAEDGMPLASAEAPYGTRSPHSGWSEQDPNDWITALNSAIHQLKNQDSRLADVRGIAVAGHMHGAVLLDDKGHALRPCILWNDTRSHAQAARLDARPEVRAISGNIIFPGFTAPKLLWVKEQEPEIFKRVAKVLLPAAFLNLYLTGLAVGDISDAAGSAWLDNGTRTWSDVLLERSAMHRNQMPDLVEGCVEAGRLRDDLRREWGMSHSVTVAGGAADNAAAACGVGTLKQGEGFVSLGTSGVVLLARDAYNPAPELAVHTFCHAIPETWYQMGVMLSATESLNWLSRVTSCEPSVLTGELGQELEPPAKPLFLPYLSGERTPHNDAAARGGFLGLSGATERRDVTRAVLQGVSYGLRDCLSALRSGGDTPDALHLIGGGAKSDYWAKLLATVLGVSLARPDGGEFGAALGAARLAECAATGADSDHVMIAPKTVTLFEPDLRLAEAYDAEYQRFRAAFPAVRNLS